MNGSTNLVDEKLDKQFVKKTFVASNSTSVAANSTQIISIDSFSIPTGYMTFGITSCSTGDNNLFLVGYSLSDGYGARVFVNNPSASSKTAKPTMGVVFIKAGQLKELT